MNVHSRPRILGPSLLARKILCSAYVSAPFSEKERFKFQALHAMTVVKVIARHLKMGYILKGVERGGNGYRVDLLFSDPSGKTRLDEVKSSRKVREVHKIQAALYAHSDADEIAVSNGQEDQILTPKFIREMQERAVQTIQLLSNDPTAAASTYTPHEDACYTCATTPCPFLSHRPRLLEPRSQLIWKV